MTRAGVNVELRVLLQEVAAVDGHDDEVVIDCEWHEIPILPATLADMGNVGGVVTARLRDRDQIAGQALVNQEAVHQVRGAAASADFQSGP